MIDYPSATVWNGEIICDACGYVVLLSAIEPWKIMDVHMEIHMPYPRTAKTVSGGSSFVIMRRILITSYNDATH